MARMSTDFFRRRRGIIAVFVAVSMIFILGMVAITLDGGGLLDRRRHAQATADASAMAAACVLYTNYPTYAGAGPVGTATDAALTVAATNGFTNDTTTSTVEVNIPPASGPYAGLNGYAEVIVTYQQSLSFARIFGKNKTPVKARAVARGVWVPHAAGVIVLDYTGQSALNAQGNGSFTETGGPVIINSNNDAAVTTAGNGSLKAESFFITGKASLNGSQAHFTTQPIPNQVFEGVHPTPDPLAYLPQPTMPPNGTMTETSLGSGNKQYVLTPGTYSNLPTFNAGDVVILKQASANGNGGIFYINGGGFKSTGATVKMDTETTGGVMIFNKPADNSSSQKIQISGNPAGEVNLSSLESGPYQGFMLWQNRASDIDMLIEGNGNFTMKGSLYAAGAKLNVNGNGGTTADEDGRIISGANIGSQYIVKDLSLGGNGNVFLKYKGQAAHTRVLTLVE